MPGKNSPEISFLAPDKGAKIRIALLYPNTLRTGGAYLGLAALYRIVNTLPGFSAERFFLPEANQPFLSQESKRELKNFDLILASIAFENDAPNLLTMLRLAKMPILSAQRVSEPLLVVGGIVPMLNPEPLAQVADAFLLGEAEVVLEPFLRVWEENLSLPREKFLLKLAQNLPYLYAPRFYRASFDENGRPRPLELLAQVPTRIQAPKYAGGELAASMFVNPAMEMGDMYLQELGRGCPHGCRFCAAGHIYRPPRLLPASTFAPHLLNMAQRGFKLGLVSAAINDIEGMDELATGIVAAGGKFSVSSLRADTLSPALLNALAACGQKTIALAPEAGSPRLRGVINKHINEEQLARAVSNAIEAGMLNLRLYFMIGLPSEEDSDLRELAALVDSLRQTMLAAARAKGRLGSLVVSLNPFIPKPFTPFQWQPMLPLKEIKKRYALVQKALRPMPNVRLIHESPRLSLLQAALSRGDRRLIPHLLALSQGQRPPAAPPYEFFACRERGMDEYLPWNIVDHGIKISYLKQEAALAGNALLTAPCPTNGCHKCGMCA